MSEKFNLIAIYGPSGCGKDTIKRAILKKDKVLFNNIIGATTRPKREKEINGNNTGKKNNRTTKQTKIIIFKKVNNFFFKVINALFLIIILNVSS